MKRTVTFLTIVLLVSRLTPAQDFKAKTGKFQLTIGDQNPPELVWIYPKNNSTALANKQLELQVGVNSSSDIKSVKAYINDLLISDRGLKIVEENHNFDQLYKKDIVLSDGKNIIRMEVENINGLITKEERFITVTSEFSDILSRRDFALLFATDQYDEWKDLVNPINDAETIAKELEENYGFQVELIKNATQEEIWKKLREYNAKSYLEKDQLFIFFAGHGQFDEEFNEGFLVAKDSKVSDIGKSSYISYNRLRPLIDRIPSNHIFLAMDACFGGTFDPVIANAGARGEDNNIYTEVNQLEYIKRKLRYKTRKFVTSGGKEYVPDGRPGMHSPFARKLIEALRGEGGNDRVLTIQEIYGYVEKLTPEPRAGEFGSNAPGSEFVFVFKKQ